MSAQQHHNCSTRPETTAQVKQQPRPPQNIDKLLYETNQRPHQLFLAKFTAARVYKSTCTLYFLGLSNALVVLPSSAQLLSLRCVLSQSYDIVDRGRNFPPPRARYSRPRPQFSPTHRLSKADCRSLDVKKKSQLPKFCPGCFAELP